MESREHKPSWSDVPREVVAQLADLLGARIAGAEIVWGGFGPSATFLIRTDDGHRFFCKGTHPGLTEEVGKSAFPRELALYTALPELRSFGPAFHGAVAYGEWQLLVLDFVERAHDVPPWTEKTFRAAIGMLARFHHSMPSRARAILDDAKTSLTPHILTAQLGWRRLAEAEEDREGLLALFADRRAAGKWIDRNIGVFISLEEQATNLDGPCSWIHLDVRSDNLIFPRDGIPVLVDWPCLSYGPLLLDAAFFLPGVAGEGGPLTELGLTVYEEEAALRFDEHQVRVTVATVAGFFAARAGQPSIPGMPRLRWVQTRQFFPCLDWISRLMSSQPPPPPLPLGSGDL